MAKLATAQRYVAVAEVAPATHLGVRGTGHRRRKTAIGLDWRKEDVVPKKLKVGN